MIIHILTRTINPRLINKNLTVICVSSVALVKGKQGENNWKV